MGKNKNLPFPVTVFTFKTANKNKGSICQLPRLNAARLKSELVHTLTGLYWTRGSNVFTTS